MLTIKCKHSDSELQYRHHHHLCIMAVFKVKPRSVSSPLVVTLHIFWKTTINMPRALLVTQPTVSVHSKKLKILFPSRDNNQLSLTNPRDVLYYGEHAANK